MHEHDIDRIAALATGELAGTARASAAAEVASCAQCTADLEAQQAALAYLADAPRVYLTATESARLRAEVRSAVGLKPDAAKAPAPRRRFRLGALAGAAAVLVAVVAAAPAFDLIGGGDNDTGAEVAISAPVTERADAEALPPNPAAVDTAAATDRQGDVADGGTLPPAEPSTGAEMAAAPPALDGDVDLFALKSAIEAGDDLAGVTFAAPAADAEFPDGTADGAPPEEAMTAVAGASSCDPETVAGFEDAVSNVFVGPVQRDGIDGLIVAYIGPDGEATVVVLDASTCKVIEST